MIINGNAIHIPLKDESVQLCAFSPPYWGLRAYQGLKPSLWPDGTTCDLGLEPTPELYLDHMAQVMAEVRRVLKPDGVCFTNIGDSYSGSQMTGGNNGINSSGGEQGFKQKRQFIFKSQNTIRPKSLCLIPQKFAIRCQEAGWIVRSIITWCKGNPMPESCKDRPTRATEDIFMLTKNGKYFYDSMAVRGFTNTADKISAPSNIGMQQRIAVQPVGMASQRCNISSQSQWPPYFILAALLCSEGVFIKQRDDLFCNIFNIFKLPGITGSVFDIFRDMLVNVAPKIFLDVLQNINVVISQTDLEADSVTWRRFVSSLFSTITDPRVDDKGSFSIKETAEIIAKLIGNAQIIKEAFPFDSLSKSFINVDMINSAIPFSDSFWLYSKTHPNISIIESLCKKLDFFVRKNCPNNFGSFVWHRDAPLMDGLNDNVIASDKPSCQGHNLRNWWLINTEPTPEAHFATWPTKLVERMIRAASKPGDIVLDPFCGTGKTVQEAERLSRVGVGLDLSLKYLTEIAARRLSKPLQRELIELISPS